MALSEELIHGMYDSLFFNLDESSKVVRETLNPTLMDQQTFQLLEIDRLFGAVNYTRTKSGEITLKKSMVQPPSNLDIIHAKQDSLMEMEKNGTLREKLDAYVASLAKNEGCAYELFNELYWGENTRHDQYEIYKGARDFLRDIVDGAKTLPDAETFYLKTLLNDIRALGDTQIYRFIKEGVYKTSKGLESSSLVKFYTPRIKFTFRKYKPTVFALGMALPLALNYYFTGSLPITLQLAFFYIMGPLHLLIDIPNAYDKKNFVMPLAGMYQHDINVNRAVESLGRIDELLSFYKYSQKMGHEMAMPTVTESDNHYFVAKNMRNPIIAKGNSDYVPNDAELKGQKLTVLTGPVSGGKTTICKTIAQIQVLAQLGCRVPAKEAELSIADYIAYQAPMFNSLTDEEGRFGTELKRTREIFFKTTPRSMVILDDSLAGASTHAESTKISHDIINGFYTIGNNTIVITHNVELAKMIYGEGRGQYLQAEFYGETPTYRIIEGIAERSHAEEVAKKIGFSRKHMQDHLRAKGYLK